MMPFLKNTKNQPEKKLKKYYKLVTEINNLEPIIAKLSDQQLRDKTIEFKEALQNGKTIFDIQVEAFAVVREASKRVLNMRHFDVQLIGGLVLTEGNIAEMATGEGKTLVASLPSYLRALEGKGVHVITVNEYLARRDRSIIGKIHEFLGLTVGLNLPMMETDQKQMAYNADITYGVGQEFGFDYLRDHMVRSKTDRVQRPFHFAIIDEVDSVLIDEAKTPLIIAGKMKSSPELYKIAAKLAKRFEQDVDYEFDDETKATSLTDVGIQKVEKAFGVDNLYELEHQTLYHYMIQAVRAHVMFKRDVDYIIKDGKVMLVDMFTGRIMDGRTLSDGLHQAIEAKEGVEITEENKTQASITIQNYFRMYPKLAGMTGTAKTEEKEFLQVYGMEVVPIPTNMPVIREDLNDMVFATIEDKYKGVVEEVKARHSTGQPILIGTTSILQSEKVAQYLKEAGLKFELLNAKSVEQEVELISAAGQKGQITIATNMAGRGTDIMLGEGVAELGGLHVLGTEKHESRRIDNQLRGRAGRQGDPGSSQFFISIEDEMFRRFAKDDVEKFRKKMKVDEIGYITNYSVDELVTRTQRIVEGANFSMREYNLKLDDVINEQRGIVYKLRNRVLDEENLIPLGVDIFEAALKHSLEETCPEDEDPVEWNFERLKRIVQQLLHVELDIHDENVDDIEDIWKQLKPIYNEWKTEVLADEYNETAQYSLRFTMLNVIDHYWIRHLENMTRLKEGIGLRYYQQEDPVRIYAREGLELFSRMYATIEREISLNMANLIRALKQESEVEQ
ncbi:preprotein translocase subunit SecA [Bacillus oleivorans]|uniref:Protein translocase subunit SecA n=1 Tax=Bacillus oleivorans TaxID=1448271 RepID=A0A285CZG9_9BACI|nr:accessory Sec system translocase SecA2 [Bacillus oleivorans]SNX72950.1 preprotein translocase subunit SecA [Bacillus oleivorans]